MTEVWFYHLQGQPLEKVLPSIVEKSLGKGWRVAIQARSNERLDALDSLLWTYSDTSFLPHGRAGDGNPYLQPVYLTSGSENPNGAALRLLVDGADIAPVLAGTGSAYARIVTLFDGNNASELEHALQQWKQLKTLGLPVTYWQQGVAGRWEKKS